MVWPLLQYINFKFVPLPVYLCVLAFYLVSIVPGSLYQHFCFLLEHLFVPISKQKCSKARLSVSFSWFWSSSFLMNYSTMFYWWSAIIFLMIWYIWLVCCKIELKHEDSLIITELVDYRCVKKERFIAYTSLSSKQSQRKWVFFLPFKLEDFHDYPTKFEGNLFSLFIRLLFYELDFHCMNSSLLVVGAWVQPKYTYYTYSLSTSMLIVSFS